MTSCNGCKDCNCKENMAPPMTLPELLSVAVTEALNCGAEFSTEFLNQACEHINGLDEAQSIFVSANEYPWAMKVSRDDHFKNTVRITLGGVVEGTMNIWNDLDNNHFFLDMKDAKRLIKKLQTLVEGDDNNG